VGFMVFPTDNRGSTNIQVVISVKVPSLEGLFAPRRKDFLTIPATDASLALFIETQWPAAMVYFMCWKVEIATC